MTTLAITPAKNSVEADVFQQFKAEVGDQTLTEAQTRMLQQKYGILPAQLTATDRNLIGQEERRNRMFPHAA